MDGSDVSRDNDSRAQRPQDCLDGESHWLRPNSEAARVRHHVTGVVSANTGPLGRECTRALTVDPIQP